MKKFLVLAAVVCLFSLSVFAQQAKTNFAGTWELDVKKSKLPEMSRIETMTMTVAQTDKDLKVESATKRAPRPEGDNIGAGAGNRRGNWGGGFGGDGTQVFNYSLEGKETSTEAVAGIPAASAILKANLEKDGKLKLSSTRKFNSPQMGEVTATTKETWELLDGGKTLKVVRETDSRRGPQTSEMYFTKK